MALLKAGDKAPDFTAKNQNDKEIKLSDYRGKKVVLYFYPKDNTPGCTVEACNLRDNISALKAAGYVVLGVSKDDVKSHSKFVNKFELPFDLVADPDKTIMNDYGVWGEKKFLGRTYMGTNRVTYIIDENGIIERVIDKVKTKDHTKQILEEV